MAGISIFPTLRENRKHPHHKIPPPPVYPPSVRDLGGPPGKTKKKCARAHQSSFRKRFFFFGKFLFCTPEKNQKPPPAPFLGRWRFQNTTFQVGPKKGESGVWKTVDPPWPKPTPTPAPQKTVCFPRVNRTGVGSQKPFPKRKKHPHLESQTPDQKNLSPPFLGKKNLFFIRYAGRPAPQGGGGGPPE